MKAARAPILAFLLLVAVIGGIGWVLSDYERACLVAIAIGYTILGCIGLAFFCAFWAVLADKIEGWLEPEKVAKTEVDFKAKRDEWNGIGITSSGHQGDMMASDKPRTYNPDEKVIGEIILQASGDIVLSVWEPLVLDNGSITVFRPRRSN